MSIKLNKETLEASFSQIEYLKTVKKDHISELCKLFDGKISEEDLEEFHRIFASLDPETKNEMPVSQMGMVLNMLQQLPTEAEVVQLIETVNPKKPENQEKKSEKPKSGKGEKGAKDKAPEEVVETIDFYKFLLALALYLRDPAEIAEEIKKSFRVLDRHNQGYLMAADLRDFLSRLGDVLTDEEIDELLKLADTENNGQIHYEQFVDMMTNMQTGGKTKGKKGKKGKKKKK